MTTMNEIEAACKAARQARDTLGQSATMLHEAIEALKRKHLPALKRHVAKVADADAQLMALLQAAPGLFVRPRSLVFHGIKVGYKKGAGKIEIADADKVVALIEKHFPEQFDLLVKTTRKPIKKALQELSGADLKKLGIKVEDTGDVVFITDATDAVDKLVAALIKGEEEEHQDEEATA